MTYAQTVKLSDLPAKAQERLATLKHGEKKDVADALDISQGYLSHWITGRREMPVDVAEKVLNYFNIRVNVQTINEHGQVEE